jgi:hypothetical protein
VAAPAARRRRAVALDLGEAGARGAGAAAALLQQLQRGLRLRVGLRQDRDRGLLQDRVARQRCGLDGDVDVADARLGGREVLGLDLQVGDRGRQAVLRCAQLAAHTADRVDGDVQRRDRDGREAGRADVERRQA